MPTLDERAQDIHALLHNQGLFPRRPNPLAGMPEVLMDGPADPEPVRKPSRFPDQADGSVLYSLYQSHDHALRLYVTYKDEVPTYSFTAYGVEPAPEPMLDPPAYVLVARWAGLVHQYRLGHDMAYLKEKLIEAGMAGAMRVATHFQESEQRQAEERAEVQAFMATHGTDAQEEVATLLRRTAIAIERHRGGFVLHDISEVKDDKGFACGCSVYVTGYMGG